MNEVKNKFIGELSRIAPNKLIKENGNGTDNDVACFFVGLGAIFNDLRDLVLFESLILNNCEKPEKRVSVHTGSYTGVFVYINKLIASTIHEFFNFLNQHDKILDATEFKEILDRLSQEDKAIWHGLVAASQGNLANVSDLLKSIVRIRNNVAYHYDHSGKILKRGYISRFFGEYHDESNEYAYYSIGDRIENTRFYFSDAAIEESLFIEAGKKEKKKFIGDQSFTKYQTQLRETISVVTRVISILLKNFLQFRRNKP